MVKNVQTHEKIADVMQTSDYSLFHRLDGNRRLVKSRKNKILKSIENVGYILNPIIVNKNMDVIDGQGRLEALKELGLPVPYVVAGDIGIEECIALNINMTNWKVQDYIDSYAEMGNINYITFKDFRNTFPKFTLDVAYGLVTNKVITNGYGSIDIRDGSLICNDEIIQKCLATATWLHEMYDVIDKIPGTLRVKFTAIAWVVRNTKADANRLKVQLMNRWPLLQPAIDQRPDLFLQSLSDVYNRNLSAKNCLYFDTEYKQRMREKSEEE